jgi:hypothetical protein
LIKIRKEMNLSSPWTLIDHQGEKMKFNDMNDLVLEKLEILQLEDEVKDELGLRGLNIREDFSIN